MLKAALALALVLAAPAAGAPARRVAVVVGNDLGAPADLPLRFARTDATRVAQVLRELGGVRSEDLFLVLDGDAAEVREALARARRTAADSDAPAVLFFYYSGHADDAALHLGPSLLPWAEVRGLIADNPAALRIAIVDACQAGVLTTSKGLRPVADLEGGSPARGTAYLVAADTSEAAQESAALGGGVFTHYFLSALRGAADADRDGRVTLSEAHAYAARQTREATGRWARGLQHPAYHFDVEGHEEAVLTELRDAAATLEIDEAVAGYVVVGERESGQVTVETEKGAGQPLRIALPTGRYWVHVRRQKGVYLAEVTLPWGGAVRLGEKDLTARSYQEVAQRGGTLEVQRHRVRAGVAVESDIVQGMGPSFAARLSWGVGFAPVELGLRAVVWRKAFGTVDTAVTTDAVGLGALIAYERPLFVVDLRGWLVIEAQHWWQQIEKAASRRSWVGGLGLGVGVRVPLAGPFFADVAVEGMGHVLNLNNVGLTVRPTAAGEVSFGVRL